jgi:alkanesulfonate monooxygenase SsuD/methylene tetrahydromethanopterin reductase-like flavin-dependent oxidoreductase (luciferase family)
MSQVQFGLILPIGNADLSREVFLNKIRQALETIKGHFASAWVADHLQFGSRPLLDGWTLLAFLTAWCPDLDYGHLVLCQLFRNPAVVAKMAATFQYMSQGHFIFGFGAGWAEEEARAYNLPFPAPGPRVSELDEQLQIIKALWREDDVTFEGTYHKVTNVHCLPHPEPLPPLLVAAHQPRMMRVAVRHADWWNTGVENLEKARNATAALDAACEAVGRDPQTLRRTAMISCACAPNEQQLQTLLAAHKGPVPSYQGTPAQIIEQLQPIVEAGFDYFMISGAGMPQDFTTLELLAHEVLPALNK